MMQEVESYVARHDRAGSGTRPPRSVGEKHGGRESGGGGSLAREPSQRSG